MDDSNTPAPELPIERLFAIDWHVWRASVDRGLWVADGRIASWENQSEVSGRMGS